MTWETDATEVIAEPVAGVEPVTTKTWLLLRETGVDDHWDEIGTIARTERWPHLSAETIGGEYGPGRYLALETDGAGGFSYQQPRIREVVATTVYEYAVSDEERPE